MPRAPRRTSPSSTAGPTARSGVWRHAAAVAAVLAAGVLQWTLIDSFGPLPPFIAFYPAVLLVALLAGSGPGTLAAALSLLIAEYLSTPSTRGSGLPWPSDALAIGMFVGTSLVLCLLAEIAGRMRPQVALLDIGMPRLSGYEVATRIRSEPWGAAIRLIAMTGWGQDSDKLAAKQAGFDRHLTKPVDPAQLEALLS